jgi:hypothetical protein
MMYFSPMGRLALAGGSMKSCPDLPARHDSLNFFQALPAPSIGPNDGDGSARVI